MALLWGTLVSFTSAGDTKRKSIHWQGPGSGGTRSAPGARSQLTAKATEPCWLSLGEDPAPGVSHCTVWTAARCNLLSASWGWLLTELCVGTSLWLFSLLLQEFLQDHRDLCEIIWAPAWISVQIRSAEKGFVSASVQQVGDMTGTLVKMEFHWIGQNE